MSQTRFHKRVSACSQEPRRLRCHVANHSERRTSTGPREALRCTNECPILAREIGQRDSAPQWGGYYPLPDIFSLGYPTSAADQKAPQMGAVREHHEFAFYF